MAGRRTGAPLPLALQFGYGLGQLGDAVVHFSFETLVFFYYVQVLGLSGTLAGSAVFIALLFDALSDPVVGSLSDSTRSRLGRRHPFLFAGPLPLAVCFYFLFVPPEGLAGAGLFMWLTLLSILARTCLTLFSVPYMSLGAELSTDYVGRTWVVANRMSFGAIGWIGAAAVAFFGFFRPTEAYPIGHMNPSPYAAFAFAMALFIASVQLVSAVSTLRAARAIPVAGRGEAFHPTRVLRELRMAFSQASFRWFAIAGVVAAVALGLRQTLVLHLNTFFWELTSTETGLVMVVTLGGLLIGFPFWAWLSRRIEKRRVFQAGLWVLGICVLLPPVLRALGAFPANTSKVALVPIVAAFSLLSALGGTGAQLAQGSMAADIADESALETGRRHEGIFFAAVNVLVKCASGLGHQVGGIALDWIGLETTAAPGSVPEEVVGALGWVYGLGVMLAALVAARLIGGYRLDRARVEVIQQRLAERAEAGR